jgi:Xaa-Pro dipeptidase
MRPTYAAFSESEHRERLERARDILRSKGIAVCISVAPEHLFYFGGYDSWVSVNSPQALIFSAAGGEPTLVVRDVDLALPRETSWIEDVRSYHLITDDVPKLIAGVAQENGLGDGKAAIEAQSYALPYALGQAIARAIAPASLVDCTDDLSSTRLVKSPAEMRYIEEAARFAGAGLEAARRALKPGMSEIDLAGVVENAMREAGSDYWSIPTELSSGPRTSGGHATPRERPIEPGDLVHLEFAGVSRRYHAAAIHTMSLGAPSRQARELYHHARQSLAAGIAAVRPGAPVADIEEASLDPLRRAGLDGNAVMRFGYGIGIAYPPIWLEPLQITRGVEQVLQPGMVFVLHAYIQLLDEGLGIVQGGTYALTTSGLRMLVGGGDVPLEIV